LLLRSFHLFAFLAAGASRPVPKLFPFLLCFVVRWPVCFSGPGSGDWLPEHRKALTLSCPRSGPRPLPWAGSIFALRQSPDGRPFSSFLSPPFFLPWTPPPSSQNPVFCFFCLGRPESPETAHLAFSPANFSLCFFFLYLPSIENSMRFFVPPRFFFFFAPRTAMASS